MLNLSFLNREVGTVTFTSQGEGGFPEAPTNGRHPVNEGHLSFTEKKA